MTKSSLQQIIQTLNDAHVRYMVVGGIAVAAHGQRRLISNVELLLPAEESNIARAISALHALGYLPIIPVAPNPESIRLKSPNHHETMIDILLAHPTDFDAASVRAQSFALSGLAVPICGYDDLVAAKTKRGTSMDLLDLHELTMARSALSQPEEDPWTQCTFEGSERANLRRVAALSFAAKLDWLDDARQLAQGLKPPAEEWA